MRAIDQIGVMAEQIEAMANMLAAKFQGGDVESETLANVIREKAETIGQLSDAEALK